jgi:hypothetical protein
MLNLHRVHRTRFGKNQGRFRSAADFFDCTGEAIIAAWIEFLALPVLRVGVSAVSLAVGVRRKGRSLFEIYLDHSA